MTSNTIDAGLAARPSSRPDGKLEILKQYECGLVPLEKDQDAIDVTLRQGVNVLVFKVVNEKIDWSGCARFTDKDGKVIRNLKVTTVPK